MFYWVFCFFKQKTAYEMRISDWSSDVCSSDLASAPWLTQALDAASRQYYDAPCGYIGQGGTIPLMSLLQQGFPRSQFMVCGVLGPQSNAHGPNEFLHVPYGKKLTAAVAQTIAALPAHRISGSRVRSAERRVGNEGVSTCKSRWGP